MLSVVMLLNALIHLLLFYIHILWNKQTHFLDFLPIRLFKIFLVGLTLKETLKFKHFKRLFCVFHKLGKKSVNKNTQYAVRIHQNRKGKNTISILKRFSLKYLNFSTVSQFFNISLLF